MTQLYAHHIEQELVPLKDYLNAYTWVPGYQSNGQFW